jgi:putative transposase
VRKLRVEYPGAIYHLMNRADPRKPIFLEDRDRKLFLETLAETCQKTAVASIDKYRKNLQCLP